jgi:putative ABC transport system substrate-binding protein
VRALQATAIRSPIVFAIHSDPVGDNAVESLARPGGNVTGLSMLNSNLEGKRLEVLKEVLPALKRVLILYDPTIGSFRPGGCSSGGTGPCTGTSVRTDQQSHPIQ